jgi:hypothetical protein
MIKQYNELTETDFQLAKIKHAMRNKENCSKEKADALFSRSINNWNKFIKRSER